MLHVTDVKKSFSGTSVLNGVTFSLEEGTTVGLIGPNGSGKTTLFNCVSGFLYAESGSIVFRDTPITKYRPFRRARLGLGRVFQNFGIFKEMTVAENIITALEARQPWWSTFLPWSRAHKKNMQLAREHLEEIGLQDKAHDKAGSLSGGQMRLLEIMRTLAFGADLFLLDEPTAGVSPRMKEDVAGLIRRLQDLNKTVLIIEHDINFIQKFCDRIIVLDMGRIVLDDTPDGVRSNPMLQQIYFGSADKTAENTTGN